MLFGLGTISSMYVDGLQSYLDPKRKYICLFFCNLFSKCCIWRICNVLLLYKPTLPFFIYSVVVKPVSLSGGSYCILCMLIKREDRKIYSWKYMNWSLSLVILWLTCVSRPMYRCMRSSVSKSKATWTCCVNVYTCLYLNVCIIIIFSYCKIFACKRTLYITSNRDYWNTNVRIFSGFSPSAV